MNPSIKDMLEALESDNDFRTLKQKYESPNEFTIMGNKRREEWHSSFVSWLLNPKQNHKLGKFPLEKFLELVESKGENLEIDKTDIADMKFETEHRTNGGRKIDIFGTSRSLVLVIENKIKASETFKNGIPQSNDYYKYCEEKYKDRQRCYILLKAFSNSSVANENFISITYQELFDEVIKPACENCQKLKIEDTKRVLEQYALDISNPFTNSTLATTQKDISCEIYKKHAEIIEKIRITMRETDRDNESDIYKFFHRNIKYINNIILKSLGKNIIKPRTEELKKLKGNELLNVLLDYNYIIPNRTELIYKYMSATCIIMVDENRKFYTGYCMGDYDGSQEVDILQSGFERLRDAELAVEKEVGSQNCNGGKSAYELMLLNSGIEEAEGKKIGDILKLL
ncbi:PD-(D/E)XK nuclease family protein [Clostridium perfringens]|nr:PD-(D/E)XK nuclease family protein [Clostridium perfringens]EHK2365108.1 PD-(D/E)XK nuclease family protein [Clostridium perfringens]